MNHVEILWKDYMIFENGINPIIAEKMSMEHTRDHINAKRVAREMENEIRGFNRNYPSVPPTGSPEELKQVGERNRDRRQTESQGMIRRQSGQGERTAD